MMKKYAFILIGGAIILGGIWFTRVGAQGTNTLTSVPATATPATGGAASTGDPSRDVLFLLNRLSSIKIERAIFDSKEFASLKDFGLKVTDEPYGRPNPFAPIGDDSFVAGETAVTPISVPAPSASVQPSPSPSVSPSTSPKTTKKPSPSASPANTGNGFDDGSGFFDPNL